MSDPTDGSENQESEGGADAVAVLYILGGIPAIVGFIVLLFALVRWFPSVPA